MLLHQITVNCFIFFTAFVGVSLNYNSILITLMGIELMLLCSSLNFISFSLFLNDIYGQIFSIFILTIAASESAVGLAILILMYKIKGTVNILNDSNIKG